VRKVKKARLATLCFSPEDPDEVLPDEDRKKSKEAAMRTRVEIEEEFTKQQTFELWLIFIFKFLTSLIILIDDLTFLLFCQYEFQMS
jgi:hypothetical protein